jgi:protein SCO1
MESHNMVRLSAIASVGMSLIVGAAVAAPAATEVTATAGAHEHHAMDASRALQRSEGAYVTPAVDLVRDDGKTVSLAAELDDGRPVVLNFIYTSGTTICPLSSQVFAQFQRGLGAKHEPVHLVSISIDPEQDSPSRLRAYAKQFQAEPGWDHYSGTVATSIAIQRAFAAYRGDKMSHTPLTLMRAAPGKLWVRLDGFATAADLLAERKLWLDATGPARTASAAP